MLGYDTVDPYLTARPAALDLQPYEDFYKILPDADNDFFRSPLSETARRSFLSHCPSNLDRNYRAPVLQRNVNAGTLTRRFDQQLADIQYRLSGITRPIDLMAHNLAQGRTPTINDSTDFIRTIHSLLSDVASHITQTIPSSGCNLEHINYSNTSSLSESTLVGQPSEQMERPILFTGDTYARSVHRCFRQRMGDYREQQNYERDMDSRGIGTIHQLPGTTCDMEVCDDEATTRPSTSHLLRQHVRNRLCPTLWRNAIPTTDDPGINNLGDMSDNEYSTSSHLHTFGNQPSRSSLTTANYSNRMDDRSKILSTTGTVVGDTQRRLLCEQNESPNLPILQLEVGSTSDLDECISDPMESLEESIPVPTMESTTSMSPTPTSISNIGNPNHIALAERNLVSSAPLHDQSTTTTSSTNNDPPQSTGRQSTQEESAMATTSMEYKRQRLEHHGYDDNALAILLNPEAQPSIKRYNPIQQQFLRWCNLHHLDAFNPDPAQLVNYLAYGHHALHWQVGTCLNYKSAILDLHDQQDRGRILSDHHFQKFFTNLRALTVRSFDKPNYDLTPVITKLHHWGSNDNITVEQLTRKLCFLLAITGFLRHSDLHRVNLGKTSVTANDSQLKLLIDCPKEKRQGSPIERVVIINPHPDPILCPVKAFQSYLIRVANTPCFGPHPTRPSRTINFLIRKLNDFSAPVSVQTISRHVRSLLSLIAVADDSGVRRPPLRARAVGSTNAALLGANVDDILVHGSWASSCVFDNFYRLSRQTVTNFTTMALSSNSLAINTLDTQSESPTQDQ